MRSRCRMFNPESKGASRFFLRRQASKDAVEPLSASYGAGFQPLRSSCDFPGALPQAGMGSRLRRSRISDLFSYVKYEGPKARRDANGKSPVAGIQSRIPDLIPDVQHEGPKARRDANGKSPVAGVQSRILDLIPDVKYEGPKARRHTSPGRSPGIGYRN